MPERFRLNLKFLIYSLYFSGAAILNVFELKKVNLIIALHNEAGLNLSAS